MYWQKNKKFLGFPRKALLIYGKCSRSFSFEWLCTFSFACPKEKDTKKKRAPSAFLRLRRMPSSLKDRNSLCSNSLSFLTGVTFLCFTPLKWGRGLCHTHAIMLAMWGGNCVVTLTDYVLFLSYARKKKVPKSKGHRLHFWGYDECFLPKGQELAALKQPVLLDGSQPFFVLRL